MTENNAVPQIYATIQNVSRDLSVLGVGKDGRNEQQGFSFRGIDQVLQALSPLLVKHGLTILPRLSRIERSESLSKSGTLQYTAVAFVDYDLVALDGSAVRSSFAGEGKDSGDKATSKALSMAYKYMAFQTFCIPVEGCDDSDSTTPEASAPKAGPAPADLDSAFDSMLSLINSADAAALGKLRTKAASFEKHPRFEELRTAFKVAIERTK